MTRTLLNQFETPNGECKIYLMDDGADTWYTCRINDKITFCHSGTYEEALRYCERFMAKRG